LLLTPSGPGIRRDSGMYEGWNVPIDYDPLLGKLISYGTDREQAISRLTRALNEYFVGGINTNISLFRRILSDANFRAAKVDTGFLDRLLNQGEGKDSSQEQNRDDAPAAEVAAIAAGVFAVLGAEGPVAKSDAAARSRTLGNETCNWKNASRREALR
jgi:acetyl-CoA carboxylase, biotin carboxylase subunit